MEVIANCTSQLALADDTDPFKESRALDSNGGVVVGGGMQAIIKAAELPSAVGTNWMYSPASQHAFGSLLHCSVGLAPEIVPGDPV